MAHAIYPPHKCHTLHCEGKQRQEEQIYRARADTITHSGLYPKMTKQAFSQESEIFEAKDQAEDAFSWAE